MSHLTRIALAAMLATAVNGVWAEHHETDAKAVAEKDQDKEAEEEKWDVDGDHGGVIARSKRFVYESGTHVPMIWRFPDMYKHLAPSAPNTRTDRLVSFVDLAPSSLSRSVFLMRLSFPSESLFMASS